MTSVPQRIGNYQLERQIGKGGMSEVWLGRHRSLENRLIAIKLLLSQDSEWIERFTREANITSRLRHDHIVQIFDHGYQPPYHYTIMEYVVGGGMPWEQNAGMPVSSGAPCTATLPLRARGVAGLPPDVDRVLQTMLALDPAKRYPSVRAAIDDVDQVMTRHTGPTQVIGAGP